MLVVLRNLGFDKLHSETQTLYLTFLSLVSKVLLHSGSRVSPKAHILKVWSPAWSTEMKALGSEASWDIFHH